MKEEATKTEPVEEERNSSGERRVKDEPEYESNPYIAEFKTIGMAKSKKK